MEETNSEDLAKKREEAIRYRKMKKNSNLFIFIGSLVQILESLLVLFVLLIIALLIMFKVLHLQQSETGVLISQVVFLAIFICGLVGGFFLYRKTMNWAINNFNLNEKVLASTLEHYKLETKQEKEERLRK